MTRRAFESRASCVSALHALGEMYRDGLGVAMNRKTALEHFIDSAAGDAAAGWESASGSASGSGVIDTTHEHSSDVESTNPPPRGHGRCGV